jgi:torulene dioxygenase
MKVLELLTLENLRHLSGKTGASPLYNTSVKRFRLQSIPTSAPDKPTAFVDAKAESDFGFDKNVELPTVAPSVANKPYQYAYGIHVHRENEKDSTEPVANSIIKIDVKTGDTKVWKDEDHVPGEPIFVPTPGGTEEDEGVLLTVVLNGKKGTSALVVLNAQTMEEVGRAEMSIPFPFGFHVSTISVCLLFYNRD